MKPIVKYIGASAVDWSEFRVVLPNRRIYKISRIVMPRETLDEQTRRIIREIDILWSEILLRKLS